MRLLCFIYQLEKVVRGHFENSKESMLVRFEAQGTPFFPPTHWSRIFCQAPYLGVVMHTPSCNLWRKIQLFIPCKETSSSDRHEAAFLPFEGQLPCFSLLGTLHHLLQESGNCLIKIFAAKLWSIPRNNLSFKSPITLCWKSLWGTIAFQEQTLEEELSRKLLEIQTDQILHNPCEKLWRQDPVSW